MIRDYMNFIVIAFSLSILSLVVSFSYHVSLNRIIEVFESLETEDYTSLEAEYERFYAISNIIQIAGMCSVFGLVLMSFILVVKVRFNPLFLPFAIIIYFVGIFMAMLLSNTHYYVLTTLQAYDTTFETNSFMSWFILRYPYVIAIIGAVLMILGYAKSPGSSSSGGGYALEVG